MAVVNSLGVLDSVGSSVPTSIQAVGILRLGVHSLLRGAAACAGHCLIQQSGLAILHSERRLNHRARTDNQAHEKKNGLKNSSSEDGLKSLLLEIIPRAFILAMSLWFSTLNARDASKDAGRVKTSLITTRFADVAGCDEAKHEISEFVEFLRNPEKFAHLGAKSPKGALISGPPGTGKTLLAKAVAGEANVPFFSVSGSSFVEMYVGVGASRVRELFKQARENAPCIIFIDEVDAIGRSRSNRDNGREFQNTLNQLLVEMDGFDSSSGVVIFAATNHPQLLDEAFTRAGRFDRKIHMDYPDIEGRKQVFKVYLKNDTLDGGNVEEFSSRLAELTPGMVGADIANICNEAAIFAVRKNLTKVDIACFEAAIDREIGGMEVRKVISPEERRTVAYHEAGHAIAGWYLEHADPVLKATIIPRSSGAMGFTQHLPKETYLDTREQLLDKICLLLAGRASEQVNFGKISSGASDDLRRATAIVYSMVQDLGMSELVGQVAYGSMMHRGYSDATAELLDKEVRSILEAAYQRALNLVAEHRSAVQLIAELLLSKESISKDDFTALLGDRPVFPNDQLQQQTATVAVVGACLDGITTLSPATPLSVECLA